MSTQEVVYKNRYGDEIKFEYTDKNTVRMTGGQYLRCGFKDDKDGNRVYTMVDPSGGPYLALGSDLRLFWGDEVRRIIKAIRINNQAVDFTIE